VIIRPATSDDVELLKVMLYEAARWDPAMPREPIDEVLSSPGLRRYHEAWGRPGDGGVVGELDGVAIGAAWYRQFPAEAPGFGFVDERTPELSLAVAPLHRDRGLGGALLRAAMQQARAGGFHALSLSVSARNQARLLYQRTGFRRLGEQGDSWTMLASL
jgi:ribosomal protein S18 acetylase RimI-like enzyme